MKETCTKIRNVSRTFRSTVISYPVACFLCLHRPNLHRPTVFVNLQSTEMMDWHANLFFIIVIFQMSAYIQRCQNNLLEILDEKRKDQGDGFDIVP